MDSEQLEETANKCEVAYVMPQFVIIAVICNTCPNL